MRFQHNSQVAYCHEFQENTEQYNEWKIYRVNGDDKHCVLEVENVTFASSGEYGCTGFLPDGTHLLSSVDIDVQGSPASIVTAGDFQTHVFGLWVTVILLSLLMLTLVVIGIVFFVFFVFFKRKLKKKGFSNVDAQIEHNSHHVSPDDNRVSATAGTSHYLHNMLSNYLWQCTCIHMPMLKSLHNYSCDHAYLSYTYVCMINGPIPVFS